MCGGVADHCREKASTSFARLAECLGTKQGPFVGRSPVPQTSLIFQLPDEIILHILSFISLVPWLTGHCARFRVQYGMVNNGHHQQRVLFLLPLSMTCRAMRLRFLPWIWERLEHLELIQGWSSGWRFPWKLGAIAAALRTGISPTTSVRFMTVRFLWGNAIHMFVKCLESLPYLHTLEIGRVNDRLDTLLLKNAIEGVKLPQIKALCLPPAANPLLDHCHNVEDVDWVVGGELISSNNYLEPLASIQDSKIRRLTVPLVSPGNASRFVSVCSRLAELTILHPHPTGDQVTVDTEHAAIRGLVDGCKTLPDFDTLQVVHLLPYPPVPGMSGKFISISSKERQALMERVKGVVDCAVDCLKKGNMKCQEGGGKKITLRAIGLSSFLVLPRPGDDGLFRFSLGSAEVEEYQVCGVDSKGL